MPTQAQLTALAEYIYPDADSINSSGGTNANWDADRASLFMAQTPSGYSEFYVWSGQEYSQLDAYFRTFGSTYSRWDSNNGSGRYGSFFLAVCLDQ